MNWKPGDRALIYHPNPARNAHAVGTLCTILRLAAVGFTEEYYSITADAVPCSDPRGLAVKAKYLRPIPGDEELGSWDDCVWRPKILERV